MINVRWLRSFGMCALCLLLLWLDPWRQCKFNSQGRHFPFPIATIRKIPSQANVQVIDPADGKTWPYQVFKSSLAQAPMVQVRRRSSALTVHGYLFVAAQVIGGDNTIRRAPYMFSDEGELVFAAEPIGHDNVGNFLVQEYLGEPHLTVWSGFLTEGLQTGHGYGKVMLYNKEYDMSTVDVNDETINANHGAERLPGLVDIHEQLITNWGSVLVTVYNVTVTDARSAGLSAKQWVVDGVVYEIDVESNEILWTWSALDHIPLTTSHQPLDESAKGKDATTAPWDWFHINSIQAVGTDHILISSRTTWSTYLVSRHNGSIVWSFNGETGGDFGPLPANAKFRWQHHARILRHDPDKVVISLFDNHRNNTHPTSTPSRGLIFELALPPSRSNSPKLIQDVHDEGGDAAWQGSFQANLDYGNHLLSYGDKAYAVEFRTLPDGTHEEVWRARFGFDRAVPSYRAFKCSWNGTPRRWDPSLVIEVSDNKGELLVVTGYVSWNGATEVAYWQLWAGGNASELSEVGIMDKHGFETMFEVQVPRHACLQISARTEEGKEQRRSNLVCL